MVPGSTVHVLFSKISFWLAVTTFFHKPAKRSSYLHVHVPTAKRLKKEMIKKPVIGCWKLCPFFIRSLIMSLSAVK